MRTKFFTFCICMACFSCGYNKKEAVTPVPNQNTNNNVNGGNTATVSYKNDISPIIQANCSLGGGCHSPSTRSLNTYQALQKFTIPSSGSISELEDRIKGLGTWTKMPPNKALVKSDSVLIVKWINEGANNN